MKRPSVDLATTLLNGTPFRPEMNQTMTVTEAHFEIKGEPKAKRSKTKKPKKVQKRAFGGFGKWTRTQEKRSYLVGVVLMIICRCIKSR